jgi:PAS domain S-box-containing protein
MSETLSLLRPLERLRRERPFVRTIAFGAALLLLLIAFASSFLFWLYPSRESVIVGITLLVAVPLVGMPLVLLSAWTFRKNEHGQDEGQKQKGHEEAHRTNEAYMRAVVDSAPQATYIIDRDLRVLAFNALAQENVYRATGRKIVLGTSIVPYFHPERASRFLAEIQQAFAGVVIEYEAQALIEDKDEWFQCMLKPVHFADGHIIGLVLTARNITSWKETEQRLRRSESDLRAVFESFTQAHVLVDKDVRIRMFNKLAGDAIAASVGAPPEIGDSLLENIIPERRENVLANVQKALRGETVQVEEAFASTWYKYQYIPVYDDEQNIMGITLTALNITAMKQAEIIIQQQKQLLDTTGAIAHIGGWELDITNGKIRWTKEIYHIYDVPEDTDLSAITGEFQFFHPDHRPIIQAASARLLTEGTPFDLELKFITATNKYLWVRTAGRCERGADGATKQLYGILQDITFMKEAQEEILQLNKVLEHRVEERTKQLVELNHEKDEFLGIAAHDLKNPLASIRSGAEILDRFYSSGDDTENVRRFTGMMMRACDQMVDIIANLLDVNRIESGLVSMDVQPVNMSLVDDIVKEYQERAAQKGIILNLQSGKDCTAHADKQALRQILDNLVSNAVKYSPQWKQVWIRCRGHSKNEKQYVRVEIQDEGPGLTAEDHKSLFGKFARLSATPTGGENSTGLGLSIVKKLVELQDGRVWCESEAGKGALFILELPSA